MLGVQRGRVVMRRRRERVAPPSGVELASALGERLRGVQNRVTAFQGALGHGFGRRKTMRLQVARLAVTLGEQDAAQCHPKRNAEATLQRFGNVVDGYGLHLRVHRFNVVL